MISTARRTATGAPVRARRGRSARTPSRPRRTRGPVRLRERTSVVEDERGHAQSRVQGAEQLLPVRAIDDRDVDGLVLEPEVGEEEPHLVAVARDGRVV